MRIFILEVNSNPLDLFDTWHVREIAEAAFGHRIEETHREVFALLAFELHLHHRTVGVVAKSTQDHNRQRERDPERRQRGPSWTAPNLAEHHQDGLLEPLGPSPSLDRGSLVLRRRGRTHGIRRRKEHGRADGERSAQRTGNEAE